MFGLTLNAYFYKGTTSTGYMDHSTHYPIFDYNMEGQFEERRRLEFPLRYITFYQRSQKITLKHPLFP